MSLHKAQIFAICSLTLAVFGFFITQMSPTFAANCSVVQANNSQQTVNASQNVTSISNCTLVDANVGFFLLLIGGIAAFCSLPFL